MDRQVKDPGNVSKKPRRRLRRIALAFVAVVLAVLYVKWREASNQGGQKPADPFRIAGNLYYVGANDVTSFLLTGADGHVLIDGGYPGTPPLIMESIAKLGFDIRDVKILLNSHAHLDHAGGLAELQDASGAEVWVSEGDADVLARGGAGGNFLGRFSFVTYLPFFRYPKPRVGHRFVDGDTIRLGDIELIAHVTPGHTPGCTTWEIPVDEVDHTLNVVAVCGLTPPAALSLEDNSEMEQDFEYTFKKLRSLHADVWVTTHARHFGRWAKYQRSLEMDDPVQAFIDPQGYLDYIDAWERRFHETIADGQTE